MTTRPPGWREVVLGLGAYAAYLGVRRAVWTPEGRTRARRNAEHVVRAERRVRADVEPRVQAFALRRPGVVRALNVGYAAGNVALSVGWLLRLFHRDDPSFRAERRAFGLAFAGALPIFARFPVAPPRTLDGFVDTLGGEGAGLDHPLLVRLYDPIAAMPSHHVAFAVVTGTGLARRARRRPARVAWRGYPALVTFVVVATGNHFVADVAAGALLGVVARHASRAGW